jgi:hypothetical protein
VQLGLPQHEPLVEASDGIRVLFDEVVEFRLAAQHLEVLAALLRPVLPLLELVHVELDGTVDLDAATHLAEVQLGQGER